MLFKDVIVKCYANGDNEGKFSFNAASFTLIQVLRWFNCVLNSEKIALLCSSSFYVEEYNGQWKQAWQQDAVFKVAIDSIAVSLYTNSEYWICE